MTNTSNMTYYIYVEVKIIILNTQCISSLLNYLSSFNQETTLD